MSDDELLHVSGDLEPPADPTRAILSFTFANGWTEIGSLVEGGEEHGAVLVPAGSVKCDPNFDQPEG